MAAICLSLGVLLGISAGDGAHAQSEPAAFMREATKLCVGNIARPDLVEGGFRNAGFSVAPGLDAGTFEATAPGVLAVVDVRSPRTICSIQSGEVPLAEARALAVSVVDMLFPSAELAGSGPCDGLLLGRMNPPVRVSLAQAGNGGVCGDDGTSAIIIQ